MSYKYIRIDKGDLSETEITVGQVKRILAGSYSRIDEAFTRLHLDGEIVCGFSILKAIQLQG